MTSRREVLSTVAGMSLLAGCLGGSPENDQENPTDTESGTTTTAGATDTTANSDRPDPEADSATLLLNWKPNGLHVPYYTARARGFYEDRGLPIEAIDPGEGSDFSAKQTGLGNVPFGITSSDQVLNVNSRDVSVLAVGVVMQRSPVVVFATEETLGEPLESVGQLEGARVGTGPGMVEILTELLLERHGVLESVEMVDTGYDTVQKVLQGDVDAAGGVFGDAIAAEHQGAETTSIPVAETVPSYGHVIATDPSFAESDPDAVRAFLQGTAKGAAYAMNHPEEGVDHLIEANPVLEETRDQELDNWRRMARGFMLSEAVETAGWGRSREEPWRTMAEALDAADLLGGQVEPDAVWTNAYLEAGYEYVGDFADLASPPDGG